VDITLFDVEMAAIRLRAVLVVALPFFVLSAVNSVPRQTGMPPNALAICAQTQKSFHSAFAQNDSKKLRKYIERRQRAELASSLRSVPPAKCASPSKEEKLTFGQWSYYRCSQPFQISLIETTMTVEDDSSCKIASWKVLAKWSRSGF
jgi:hypothetical protein